MGLLLLPQNDAEHVPCKKQYCVRAICVWWSPRDGTRTPKIIVLRDYVVLRIAV